MAKSVSYELDLKVRLTNKSYAVGYLNECASDNDSAVMYIALCDVIRVHPAMASFFISAYARYLQPNDLQKLKQSFPDLSDYFDSHQEVLGALYDQ